MIVRKATSNDLSKIVDFQLLMAKETENILLDKKIVTKGVLAVLNDNSKGQYYVAELNGKVMSSLLTTFEWSDWRNGTVLWIQSVYVLPEFRRKGVYRTMYSFIKGEVLNDQNLKGIRLYADKSNYLAQKTYKTLGMSPDHYVTFEWLKE
ncbi:MAG: GNAT family N-acetyltransferase [Draconibacterium sp.]|nr:GNAT family N-acetyltransferase [Draconibacterium sp.]